MVSSQWFCSPFKLSQLFFRVAVNILVYRKEPCDSVPFQIVILGAIVNMLVHKKEAGGSQQWLVPLQIGSKWFTVPFQIFFVFVIVNI